MLKFLLICWVLLLIFKPRKHIYIITQTKPDDDFEDNFLNGASEHDIDDF